MSAEHSDNLAKELFESLLDRSQEERERALFEVAEDLRHEVWDLLAFHEDVNGFLAKPLVPLDPPLPESIGPYRLIEEIGSGGTSRVFLARRSDDLHKKLVALKLIRRIVADRESEKAFRREVEALSRVEHPFIVRFLDGGLTEDGYLYFAMEYIRGEKVTTFGHSKSLRERLVLFQRVCEAVSFAHRHLIVHRDLKPSNVLVQEDGIPKLLDFGIALLMDQEKRETLTGLDRMTLAYASPEQVRGDKKLTTATDIYSLGVVLYELLTGRVPFSAKPTHETMRAIVEDDPPLMNASGVPEDLEAVVRTALQKEPERRYSTADDLRRDVGRFLDGFPVHAHRDSFVYRAQKFVRRNKKALAVLMVAMIFISAGGLSLWHQYRLAQRRLEDALDIAGAQNIYFSHEQRTPSEILEAAELNQKALVRLVKETGSERAMERLVHLLHYVGTRQGHPSFAIKSNSLKSKEVLSEAVNLAQTLYVKRPDTYTTLFSMTRTSLAAVLINIGKYGEAEEQVEKAMAVDSIASRSKDETIRRRIAFSHALLQKSRIALASGQLGECIRLRQEVIQICREAEHALATEQGRKVELGNALGLYAAAIQRSGQFAEADRAFSEALGFVSAALQADSRMDWRSLHARLLTGRGSVRVEAGDLMNASSDLSTAIATFREFEKVASTSANRRSLAVALSWQALAEKGERSIPVSLAKEAIDIIRQEADNDVANVSVAEEASEITERVRLVGKYPPL